MKWSALLAVTLCVTACDREPPAAPIESIDGGRLGKVGLLRPDEAPNALVFLFGDGSRDTQAAARQLRDAGIAVVSVDLASYEKGLRASDDGCHYVIAELEALSQKLQRQLGSSRYRSPILAGVGEGATLSYAALAQSPAATVAGAVSIDPKPALATRVPLCPGAPSTPVRTGGFAYGAKPGLPGFWLLSSRAPLAADVAALADTVEEPPPVEDPPLDRLVALVTTAAEGGDTPAALRDLPLTEIEVEKPGKWMAVIYSGDGGWRDLDKEIGEDLAKRGVPVVGVDCLRYFWEKKEPDALARDLAEIVDLYGNRWGTKQVAVVGYSFGAAVVPFAVARLPAPVRDRIVLVSLLGVGPRADFQFHAEGWLGGEPDEDAPKVLPEIVKLDLAKVQCVYGTEEDDTLCRDPALAKADLIETQGGHHFDEDYAALATRIYDAAAKRVAKH